MAWFTLTDNYNQISAEKRSGRQAGLFLSATSTSGPSKGQTGTYMRTYTLFKVFLLNANFTEPHLSMCVCQIYFRKVFTSSSRSYNWHHVSVWRLPDQAWWRAFKLGELSSSTSTSFFYHGDVGLQNATPWLGVRAQNAINTPSWKSNNLITRLKSRLSSSTFELKD